MKVVTVLTDVANMGFQNFLLPTCEYYDIPLVVLQPENSYNYIGHRQKDVLLFEFLEEDTDDNDIILFSDGHDTLLLANEHEILEKYHKFSADLVFSAEINCWPTSEIVDLYPKTNYHFKFLNSGGFIGKASFIKDLYRLNPLFDSRLDQRFNWSNQYFWHHVYLANTARIKIDHNCELFYNTSTPMDKLAIALKDADGEIYNKVLQDEKKRIFSEIEFVGSKVKNKITNTYPCHLHFPGPIQKLLMTENLFLPIKRCK